MSAPKKLKTTIKGETGLSVKVSTQIHKIWSAHRQINKKTPEACGVLIGGYNENTNDIYLEACTTPQKDDERKRTHFSLKSKSHQQAVNKAHNSSKGEQFYLGTWHSHPEKHPSPSKTDLHDWGKCMKRNPEIQLFVFAIVGTETVTIYPYKQKQKQKQKLKIC